MKKRDEPALRQIFLLLVFARGKNFWWWPEKHAAWKQQEPGRFSVGSFSHENKGKIPPDFLSVLLANSLSILSGHHQISFDGFPHFLSFFRRSAPLSLPAGEGVLCNRLPAGVLHFLLRTKGLGKG